jgi:hypothetical protein
MMDVLALISWYFEAIMSNYYSQRRIAVRSMRRPVAHESRFIEQERVYHFTGILPLPLRKYSECTA